MRPNATRLEAGLAHLEELTGEQVGDARQPGIAGLADDHVVAALGSQQQMIAPVVGVQLDPRVFQRTMVVVVEEAAGLHDAGLKLHHLDVLQLLVLGHRAQGDGAGQTDDEDVLRVLGEEEGQVTDQDLSGHVDGGRRIHLAVVGQPDVPALARLRHRDDGAEPLVVVQQRVGLDREGQQPFPALVAQVRGVLVDPRGHQQRVPRRRTLAGHHQARQGHCHPAELHLAVHLGRVQRGGERHQRRRHVGHSSHQHGADDVQRGQQDKASEEGPENRPQRVGAVDLTHRLAQLLVVADDGAHHQREAGTHQQRRRRHHQRREEHLAGPEVPAVAGFVELQEEERQLLVDEHHQVGQHRDAPLHDRQALQRPRGPEAFQQAVRERPTGPTPSCDARQEGQQHHREGVGAAPQNQTHQPEPGDLIHQRGEARHHRHQQDGDLVRGALRDVLLDGRRLRGLSVPAAEADGGKAEHHVADRGEERGLPKPPGR